MSGLLSGVGDAGSFASTQAPSAKVRPCLVAVKCLAGAVRHAPEQERRPPRTAKAAIPYSSLDLTMIRTDRSRKRWPGQISDTARLAGVYPVGGTRHGLLIQVLSIAWKEVCSAPTALQSDACSQRSPDLPSALQIRVRKDTPEMKLKIRRSGTKRRRLSGFRTRRRSPSGRRILAGHRRRRK